MKNFWKLTTSMWKLIFCILLLYELRDVFASLNSESCILSRSSGRLKYAFKMASTMALWLSNDVESNPGPHFKTRDCIEKLTRLLSVALRDNLKIHGRIWSQKVANAAYNATYSRKCQWTNPSGKKKDNLQELMKRVAELVRLLTSRNCLPRHLSPYVVDIDKDEGQAKLRQYFMTENIKTGVDALLNESSLNPSTTDAIRHSIQLLQERISDKGQTMYHHAVRPLSVTTTNPEFSQLADSLEKEEDSRGAGSTGVSSHFVRRTSDNHRENVTTRTPGTDSSHTLVPECILTPGDNTFDETYVHTNSEVSRQEEQRNVDSVPSSDRESCEEPYEVEDPHFNAQSESKLTQGGGESTSPSCEMTDDVCLPTHISDDALFKEIDDGPSSFLNAARDDGWEDDITNTSEPSQEAGVTAENNWLNEVSDGCQIRNVYASRKERTEGFQTPSVSDTVSNRRNINTGHIVSTPRMEEDNSDRDEEAMRLVAQAHVMDILPCGTITDTEGQACHKQTCEATAEGDTQTCESTAETGAETCDATAETDSQTCVTTAETGIQTCVTTAETGTETCVTTAETDTQIYVTTAETGTETSVTTAEKDSQTCVTTAETGIQTCVTTSETGTETCVTTAETDTQIYVTTAETGTETCVTTAETDTQTCVTTAETGTHTYITTTETYSLTYVTTVETDTQMRETTDESNTLTCETSAETGKPSTFQREYTLNQQVHRDESAMSRSSNRDKRKHQHQHQHLPTKKRRSDV